MWQVESLEEQIAEVKAEIAKYKGHGTTTDNQRKQVSGRPCAQRVTGGALPHSVAGGRRGWGSSLGDQRS